MPRDHSASPAIIDYDDTGSGPPVVFVHGAARRRRSSGAASSTRLERATAASCPTLPLGSHRSPMRDRDADLTPARRRRLIARAARGARPRRRHARRQRHRRRDLPARRRSTRGPSASAGWCSPPATRSRTSRRTAFRPLFSWPRSPRRCCARSASRCGSRAARRLPLAFGLLDGGRSPTTSPRLGAAGPARPRRPPRHHALPARRASPASRSTPPRSCRPLRPPVLVAWAHEDPFFKLDARAARWPRRSPARAARRDRRLADVRRPGRARRARAGS